MLEWIRTAVKDSHDDETQYHREVVDERDGKIGEHFYEQNSAEWREDQKDILRRLEEPQDASQSDMDEARMLEQDDLI